MSQAQKVIIVAIVATLAIVGIIAVMQNQNQDAVDITTSEPALNQTQEKTIEKSMQDLEKETLENMDDLLNSEYDPARPREWPTSGPFQIDRKEYYLGEKVFLRIGGLQPDDTGSVVFLRPLNNTHYSVYMTIPFDAIKKQAFNYYIDPKLAKANGICSAEDLAGQWTVVFRGTDYANIKFTYLNQTIPGYEEEYYNPVC